MTPYYKDDSVTIYHAPCEEVIGTVEGADLVLTDAPYNGDIAYGGGVNDSRDWNEYTAWLAGILTKCETACKGPVMCFVSKPGMIRMSAVKPPLWVGAWISPGGGNPVARRSISRSGCLTVAFVKASSAQISLNPRWYR